MIPLPLLSVPAADAAPLAEPVASGPQLVVAGLDADDPAAFGEDAVHPDAGHD